jgi:hypothetical protein
MNPSKKQTDHENDRVTKAAGVVGSATLLSRILSLPGFSVPD